MSMRPATCQVCAYYAVGIVSSEPCICGPNVECQKEPPCAVAMNASADPTPATGADPTRGKWGDTSQGWSTPATGANQGGDTAYREQAEALIADLRARLSHYEALLVAVREETLSAEATGTGREALVEALRFGVMTSDTEAGRAFRDSIARRLLASDWLAAVVAEAKAEAWDEGYDAGHQDARAVQPTYPDPTSNPYRAGGA